MPFNTLIASVAGVLFIGFLLYTAFNETKQSKRLWLIPCVVSVLFLGFSLHAVVNEGPMGFWSEHIRNYWGNQIWFDLLLAASIGWTLILPEAKERKMKVGFWLILIACSGSIGFTAMLARLLYLREVARSNNPSPV